MNQDSFINSIKCGGVCTVHMEHFVRGNRVFQQRTADGRAKAIQLIKIEAILLPGF